MLYRYDDFMWKIIYNVLNKEKHLNIVIDKEKRNTESIDEKVVENILREKYMHGGHLDILKSMFNMILLHHGDTPSCDEFNLPYLDQSILNLLNSFKLASLKDSSEGYAILSNFKSINDMVIIKTSKTKKDNRGILFEYFIGTIGINKLRTLIPNFSYTLAIFKYNPLLIGKDRKIDVKRFCKEDSEDTRFYVVYEKIKGISMDDFVHNMIDDNDVHKLLTYILQIAFALIIAQREIGYVHYDLHTDNIILRKLPSPRVIEYDIDGKTYRIETDAIPTIIDYGFSHFVYQGIPLGGKTMQKLGIIPTLTSKGFDLYKVIMYILNRSFKQKISRFPSFKKISWIIEYFKNDPFGIYKAYQTKNLDSMTSAFDIGWENFYNLTNNSPLYNDHPMGFINWVQQVNKPFWDKYVKVSDSLYNIPSNNILESYGAKIDGKRIFNSEILDSIDDCSILENDHRSYIINKYVSDEFTKILDTFGMYIKNPDIVRKKIKFLSDKSEKNRETYRQNDLTILSIYTEELISVQQSIDLNEYEKRISHIRAIFDIKRLYPRMKILQSYIETYNNYKMFIEYSKISSRVVSDSSIDEYHSKALSIYKSYEQSKSEYIFEKLRNQLDIINRVLYDNDKNYIDPSRWYVTNLFTDSLTTIQYVVDDIRLFYPEIEYAFIDIEKIVYNIALVLIIKRSTAIYVPPRSGIQMKIAVLSSREEVNYLMYKYFKPKDISVSNFLDIVSDTIKPDGEIYNQLEKMFDRKNIPESFNGIKIVIDNERYNTLKLEDKLTLLDTGSPEMSYNILDYIGVDETNVTTINLSGIDKTFINQTESNVNGKFPFASDYFSLITSLMVLHTIDDISDLLSEIHRVLKPKGLFIIREYDSGMPWQKIISDIDTIIRSKNTSPKQNFYMSSRQIKDILKRNGFVFVDERVDSNLTKYFIFSKTL